MRDEAEEREIPAQLRVDSLFLVHELLHCKGNGSIPGQKNHREPIPKCYLHYGKQRNSDAESRKISPQWESSAHRESSFMCGFVLSVL